ncbi:MAG: type III polyketide synthase [Terriglobales bacterium]
MRIAGAGSAFPQHVYDQQAIVSALKDYWGERLQRPELLERLHARSGVERRHLVLPTEAYVGVDTWGKANSLWIEKAEELGNQAICRAITPLGIAPADIHALYVASVTGIASPSLDAKLINRMGLSPNLKRVPIFGLGCVAGAAGIARAADYVRAFPSQVAVVLCVELCSLTWRRDDISAANLLSTGLFGDGAAAVVIAGADTPFAGPQIIDTRSVFYPNTEEVMGWDISETGFRIVLSPDVPLVIKQHLREDVDSFLSERRLARKDISSWIIHTGGPKVLEAVQQTLELPEGALDASWDCLRRVGNLSSASVLCVLQDFLSRRRGARGAYSVLAAMGPGFCSELVLLRW